MSNPIEDIMNAIVDSADKDRKKHSVVYRDLVATKDSDLQTLFDVYNLSVSDSVHSMVDVVKEKYGITRISNELYRFIKSYPVEFHELSKHIEETEGRVCCVDKAYSRKLAEFKRLVAENIEEEPES